MADTVLVDGVDIESSARHLQLDGWGDLFATAGFKGDNYDPPGRDGQLWRQKSLDVGVASLMFSISSDVADVESAMAEANTEWADIVRMFPRRRPVQLTRVVSMRDGFGGYQEVRQVAAVELAESIAPSWVTQSFQRAVLTFRLLDGCWFSEEPLTFTVTAGQPVYLPAVGTVDSGNMTVTFTGGGPATQTLVNATAGVTCAYNWSDLDLASTVVVDVPKFTVKRTVGGVTVSSVSRISHTGDKRFMVVDPSLGDNEFTVSSGQAVISYWGAWL